MSEPSEPAPASKTTGGRRPLATDRRALLVLGAVFVLAGLGWWLWSTGREVTDDARVEGSVYPVAARVAGIVEKVLVAENQSVQEGDVLFELDARDYEVALAQAEADLAVARADAKQAGVALPLEKTLAAGDHEAAEAVLLGARSGLEAAGRQVERAESALDAASARVLEAQSIHQRAQLDLERLEELVKLDQVSQREYDLAATDATSGAASERAALAAERSAREAVEIARAEQEQARQALERAAAAARSADTSDERVQIQQSALASAEARVAVEEARVERARLDLEYAKVRAPATGFVTRKSIEVGQFFRVGQTALFVVSLEDVWVVANFKETQLEGMSPGQSAHVSVDTYPGDDLEARILGIGAATSSRFRLLPAENASGNFVKVVQRVPVKLELERPLPDGLQLRPGMSVVVTVRLRSDLEPAPANPP